MRKADPVPGPTPLTWAAFILMLVVDLLVVLVLFGDLAIDLSHGYGRAFVILLLAYAVGLTVGVWRIRPRQGEVPAFTLWFLPVLLQVVVYLLFWGTLLSGDDRLFLPAGVNEGSVLIAGFIALLAGPAVATPITLVARRGAVLLTTEILGLAAIGALLS